MIRQIAKKTIWVGLIFLMAVMVSGAVILAAIPDQIQISAGQTQQILNLPMKDVTISVIPQKALIPGGHSIGVKMDVKGVLVVGLEEIEGEDGRKTNPGLDAGLQIGDTILEINGEKVYNAREVQNKINSETQNKVSLKVQRKRDVTNITLKPVKAAADRQYKMGVWVRDKTAGLGTLTYYDPSNDSFGALGHAITDPDTEAILPVAEGELLNSRVESVKQGKAGSPGEIRGIFYEADEPLGKLEKNTNFGIFGTTYHSMTNPMFTNALPIGYQSEVKKGKAYLLTTLDGNRIEKFEIEIEKINHQSEPSTKSMVIRVTDPKLLKKSGGIVQGMSGSPIIQNGKIIGAVTHVFVNDPERGYGIFIEWMLQNSR